MPWMIWRGLREEDLAECLSLDVARIGVETVGHDRAIGVWRNLMRSRSFNAAVIEADPPIGCHRIVGFGASVFVSRTFAEAEISNPRPGLNARIIDSIDAGQPVVLSEAQLRSANAAGGLDLVILYPKWREGVLSVEQTAEAQMQLAVSFLHLHQGFRFHRLFTEALNQSERESYSEAAGSWQTVSDFREFYAEYPDTHYNQGRSLFVTTRQDALRVPGRIVSMLFLQYREPVLQLRDGDQRLLTAALTGLTDEDLARSLKVALPAVKRRWRSLFERASSIPICSPRWALGSKTPGVAGRNVSSSWRMSASIRKNCGRLSRRIGVGSAVRCDLARTSR